MIPNIKNMSSTLTSFPTNSAILMIAPDPFPEYLIFKQNGKFGLFQTDIIDMGYPSNDITPIGVEFGYDFAFYCDLCPVTYTDNASQYGYIALGTREGWEIYNLSYDVPARLISKGKVFDDAANELYHIIGFRPQSEWIDLNVGHTKEMLRATPDHITTLKSNEIFVFGSNLQGQHLGGAAAQAYQDFGAIWGHGIGLQGQSYAIPTMNLTTGQIQPYVDDFISFALQHPEYDFLVTRIGCGIANFNDADIAPLFNYGSLPSNVLLPQSFYDVLDKNCREEYETFSTPSAEDNTSEHHQKRLNYFLQRMKDVQENVRLRGAERAIENQDRFYKLLRSTEMEGIEDLISAIHRSTFTTAHSHSHHHYSTGTLEHSLCVYDLMKNSEEGNQFNDRDLILVGLLHDVTMGYSREWKAFSGHGRRSCAIAKKYLPALSTREFSEVAIAIERHRHNAHGNHPLWKLIRKCDQADASTCNTGYKF